MLIVLFFYGIISYNYEGMIRLRYSNIVQGRFLSRPNRFIAKVMISGAEETVHVKNTGRCRELLVSGADVWLEMSDNTARKTKYDLVSVEKKRSGMSPLMINMDSQMPNAAVEEWLGKSGIFSDKAVIEREKTYGDSRFDFRITEEGKVSYLEVKGVTLEKDGTALFPDAPTERGVKHLGELVKCREAGFGAYLVFVIQMKGIKAFSPNDETHRAFGDALRNAIDKGVKCIAVDCIVTPDSMTIDKEIPIETE